MDKSVSFDEWKEGSSFGVNSFSIFRDETANNSNCLDISALCCDEEVSGFDKEAGRTWIYPTNYPVRDYQFNIIKAAIYKNTLVSLPTGLGKTFIAAVIMYNFYRWYPLGKIVFTAPTRPLVAQQIDACYHIMGIPPGDTVEMTGGMQVAARKTAWKEKRVFFATPQVVFNDLKAGICPGNFVKCIVFDEAHRARGKYAYCQVVEILSNLGNKVFRVLALSATPGSKVEDVINVVRNLQISHLELRSEQCLDVAMYSHARKIETVVITLGDELTYLRNEYIQILDLYTRRLVQYRVITGNPAAMSKGRIVMLFKEFQAKDKGARHPQHKQIMQDFLMVITLYHGLELLTKHGARVFLNFFDEHPDKKWVGYDDRITGLLERLRDDLGVNPISLNRSTLPDGSYPEIPENIKYGHPKFDRLREIMLEHFKEAQKRNETTKAIVFCEYRESVNLVHCLLLQCRPFIKPQMFIGQGTGTASSANKEHMKAFSQKQQLRVMQAFRDGLCNTLVSTSVGEEGLDVGNVDLIICFDISTKSPVRLVQRCGRTGRERGGRVVLLVTEGREHQTLKDCIYQRDSLNKRVMQSKDLEKNLFAANPRMLPNNITPNCQKMFIVVEKKDVQQKPVKDKGQIDLRSMLGRTSSNGSNNAVSSESAGLITKIQFEAMYPHGLPDFPYFKEQTEGIKLNESVINLSEWLEWQRSLQTTVKIGHSVDSEVLSDLLKYADSKRFQLPPSTQNLGFSSQFMNTQALKLPVPKKTSGNKRKMKIQNEKRDGDIRAIFSTVTKSTKEYTEMVEKVSSGDGSALPTALINLLVELNLEEAKYAESQKCLICNKLFNCTFLNNINKSKTNIFSLDIMDNDLPDLKFFDDLIIGDSSKVNKDILNPTAIVDSDFFDKSVFDIDLDYNKTNEAKPNNDDVNKLDEFITTKYDPSNMKDLCSVNFDIGDLDDILGDDTSSSSVTSINDNCLNVQDVSVAAEADAIKDGDKTLDFFGLGSVDDIFADDDMSINNNNEAIKQFEQPTILLDKPKSPSLISGYRHCGINFDSPGSPILSSQNNNFTINHGGVTSSTPINSVSTHINKSFLPASKLINRLSSSSIFDEKTREIWFSEASSTSGNEKDKSRAILTNNNKSNISKAGDYDSMYSVTQIIDMINIPHDCKSKKEIKNEYLINKNMSKNAAKSNRQGAVSPILSQRVFHRAESPILTSQYHTQTESPIIISQSHNEDRLRIQNDIQHPSPALAPPIVDPFEISPILSTQTFNELDEPVTNSQMSITSPPLLKHNRMESHKPKDKQKIKVFNNVTIVEESSDDSDDDLFPDTTRDINQSSDKDNARAASKIRILQTEENTNTTKRKLDNIGHHEVEFHNGKRSKLAISRSDTLKAPKLSLKDKLASALKSGSSFNHKPALDPDTDVFRLSQKENDNPNNGYFKQNEFKHQYEDISMPKLSKLQKFKINGPQKLSRNGFNNLTSIESEDEFENKPKYHKRSENKDATQYCPVIKRKKKRKPKCDFIEHEAEISDDSYESSGNESLENTQSSELNGSIMDFICDEENETVEELVDQQAMYLRSVRSPNHGKFKIPVLPKKHVNVLSQIDPDYEISYEIDSFCVDGNVGLTQCDELSELDIAEKLLKEKRRKKRNLKREGDFCFKAADVKSPSLSKSNDDSPRVVKRTNKRTVLRINSDSSDEDFT